MKVTPLDIRRKEFKRSMRGYADEEVDIFLDEVADEFERLYQENTEMHDRLQRLEEQLESHAQLKTALEKTLVSAQLQADQMTANARKESELIMRDAELQARNIVSESYTETQKVQQTLVQLKHLEEDFRFKFRSLLEAHLRLLNDAPLAVPGPAAAAALIPAVDAVQAVPAVVQEDTTEESVADAAGAMAPPPPVTSEPGAMQAQAAATVAAAEGAAIQERVAESEPRVRWPEAEDQAEVQAETATAKDEVERELFSMPPAESPPLETLVAEALAAESINDVHSQETEALKDASPVPPPLATAGPEPSAAATQGGGQEEPEVHGFFFGRQMDDLDDSFVTLETPKKEDARDFEW